MHCGVLVCREGFALMTDTRRDAQLSAKAGESDSRTASLSFSSEVQVPRWFGGEILDHNPSSVRMDFMRSGRAPVLINHDRFGRPVGVVQSAEISGDKKGRAVVRFGRGAEADSVLQDVRDGILTNVSVGYRVHEMKLESSSDDGDVYRVTDWEPLEVSLVAVPADASVGVGRTAEIESLVTRAREAAHPERPMSETNTDRQWREPDPHRAGRCCPGGHRGRAQSHRGHHRARDPAQLEQTRPGAHRRGHVRRVVPGTRA